MKSRGYFEKAGQRGQLDAYIAAAPQFAQPVLVHLRKLVHRASPEMEETIKWRQPFFLYRGSLLCFMAAFKNHCSFGFWGAAMGDVTKQSGRADEGDGSRGAFGRITTISDLPTEKELLGYLRQAIVMAEGAGGKPKATRVRDPKPEVELPADFVLAMSQQKGATEAFAMLSRSCRREYIHWIVEAKRAETKARRIRTAVQWIVEGKPLNWKYEIC